MSAVALIRQCRAAGIRLQARGDRLHFDAPAGAMTPELRQRLAENKAGLLAALCQPTAADATDTRTALLALADRLGIDRSAVVRIPSADLPLWAAVPAEVLPDYLRGLDDLATRAAGKVPVGDSAPILCKGCGPVFVHPAIAAALPVVAGWPRALGCPWCAIRKAGGYVPRPMVTCEGCRHFQPDPINPAAGVGGCARGLGTHWPMQKHPCGDFDPTS